MKKLLLCLTLCLLGLSAQAQFMATTNTFTAQWNAVVDPNLTGYQLYYWAGSFTNIISVPSSQLSVRVMNLNWSTAYNVSVRSVAQQGTNTLNSPLSTSVVVITPQQPFLPPATPTGLHITGP